LCLDDCVIQPSCHNRLKSLNSFSVSLSVWRARVPTLGSVARRIYQGVRVKITKSLRIVVEPSGFDGYDLLLSADGSDIRLTYRHSRATGFEPHNISDFKRLGHGGSLHQERFRADQLDLIARADDLQSPLRVGDFVRLNSGGPTCLVVASGEAGNVVLSWRDEVGTHEHEFPRACVHRVGVIGS
jgi:uncharacterized protein YodC (DUF2158 family)